MRGLTEQDRFARNRCDEKDSNLRGANRILVLDVSGEPREKRRSMRMHSRSLLSRVRVNRARIAARK
jgi:hypothetical protein